MSKISEFLLKHGFKVMMFGFALSVIGLLVYIKFRFAGNVIPQIAFGVTIAGFLIYVTGRVFVFISRRRSQKPSDNKI